MSRIRVVQIKHRQRPDYEERIAALEQLATYPLGEDWFKVDHGADYFAFFDRMGATYYFAALDGERVVAVGCGVLRRLAFAQGRRPTRTWYLCDLKVHPDYRKQRIPLQILRHGFFPNYFRAPRGYGISMNPSDGRPNRVVGILKHWRWSPVRYVGKLLLWSLDAEQMADMAPIVSEQRGPVSYLSLGGVKDIVLQSSGQPMPLLHVQFDATAGQHTVPQSDHVHMFCAKEDNPLAQAALARGLSPSADASLVAHGMKRCDWRFVLTSEI